MLSLTQLKKTTTRSVLAIGLTTVLALTQGCASSSPLDKPSGFLPNYHLLQPVSNPPEGAQIYTYRNPDFNKANYHAVIVKPVMLYQTATDDGVSNQQVFTVAEQITNALSTLVGQRATITTQPGPCVATLSIAVTGAEIEGSGFKPRNLVPISAVIKLASMSTGLDNKKPVLMIEVKITDSTTGALLRETLTTISGDEFRLDSSSPDAFQQLAQKWIKEAYQYIYRNN